MNASPVQDAPSALARYDVVRAHTERLAAPLSPEDQTVHVRSAWDAGTRFDWESPEYRS